ncbi:MAG: bifunctional glycosyltransferase family 2/GtrA family protein [Bacteroidaceae bacterium]|nr:bifunctional glycosyltransferase family 2/GtrA family protein [Bacteroidaceae bacterium]
MEKDVVIVIPAYQPNEQIMAEFMAEVKENFEHIVIVDDGSGEEQAPFFQRMKEEGFDLLIHNVNQGKGRALKTAINHVLNNYPDAIGMVAADCDGQHCVKDILKVVARLKEKPETLVIGCRDFDKENVPLRSQFGNKMTRSVFSSFVGLNITDTQSGLRAFGRNVMKAFMKVAGERYEYETNMLIACKEKDINIEEVTISTIYIDNNATSHFNPIKDSIIIYKLFLKFILSAFSSFLLDITLFTIFVAVLPDINCGVLTKIVLATVMARTISSIYNYCMNSKVVFKKVTKSSILKYYTVVVAIMFTSGICVSTLYNLLGINATVLKIFVDSVIFFIDFCVQREWVFKKKQ